MSAITRLSRLQVYRTSAGHFCRHAALHSRIQGLQWQVLKLHAQKRAAALLQWQNVKLHARVAALVQWQVLKMLQ
jgi:hypothetical protein